MRIVIAAVGRLGRGAERELVARYIERLTVAGRGLGLGPIDEIEIDESRAATVTTRRNDEADRLLDRSRSVVKGREARIVLLDEHGRTATSPGIADQLATSRDAGVAALVFAIGGPDGHGDSLRQAAQVTLSFGAATWPHKLVRVMLAEQLYRAATILSGHPYHRV
ncbi:MAG: 23S rRNA (pseudouridine(1915)-N(3))-methyltransferase RlmH [Pseudomonadota bacterium]